MKTFTVMLLYPDYMTGNYGLDYYAAAYEVAEDVADPIEEAVKQAREEVCEAYPSPDGGGGYPEDFAVFAVLAGNVCIVADPTSGY